MRKTTATLLAALLLALAAPAAQSESMSHPARDPGGSVPVLFDAFVLRPTGFLLSIGAFGGFVLRLPIVAITRPTEIDKVWDEMVVPPARYTWIDPLGYHPED